MWLPVEVPNDLKFLWKNRLEPKIQFWVPLQYIYELIGDQIPNFPLTLHWNQKYLKSQDTNSVSLHLKLLPLTFSRRQEQYPRKSIDSLDNRCPWLDWQVILKVTGLYLLHLHQKYTWPLSIGIFSFFKVAFSKKPSWPCGGHVTNTGLIFGLSQFYKPRWWTCQ